jgi:hypothetical protein
VARSRPGVGKTVLLDYLAGPASGYRVARWVCSRRWGLAFAGLQQLSALLLDQNAHANPLALLELP